MARAKVKEETSTTTAADDDGQPEGGAPLFPGASDEWSHVDVERLEPVEEEGFLGRLPIHATEQEIRGRWGGGRFIVRAKNQKNQVKANRTVAIAGDPLFISPVARSRWIRGQGNPTEPGAPAAPAPATPAFGVAELMTFFQAMQQTTQTQQQAFLAMQAEERRNQENERRAADERRREDDRQREERRQADAKESRERDREFMTRMVELAATKPTGGEQGQMQAFTTGLTTALKLVPALAGRAGGDDDDEETEEKDDLSETVRGAARGIAEALGSRFGAGGGGPASSAPRKEDVTITGPLADQVKAFVGKAQNAGQDPNAILAGALATLDRQLDRKMGNSNGAQRVAEAVAAVGNGQTAAKA